jgi:hypothetical protein
MKPTYAILATSALAVTALAIVEAGRLHPSASASVVAPLSTGANGVTMLTASTGQGPDEAPYESLFILDNRTEMIFVYGIESPTDRRLVLRSSASLPALFRAARGG